MFQASRIGGCCDFATFFEALPIPARDRIAAVSRFLDVSPASVRLWLSGRRDPPRAAVIALWHESAYGRAAVGAHIEEGARLARAHAAALSAALDQATATIDRLTRELADAKQASAATPGAANDPLFNWRNPDTRPR